MTFALGIALAESLNDSQILGIYIQVNGCDIETALLGQEGRVTILVPAEMRRMIEGGCAALLLRRLVGPLAHPVPRRVIVADPHFT